MTRAVGPEVPIDEARSPFSWTPVSQWQVVYRGSTLVAAVQPNGQTYHLHPDHLGTPRLITDVNKNRVAYHVYYPYGVELSPLNQDAERLKFTGHERDLGVLTSAADDLDYMHARYYNPQVGRFLSVDPVLGKPEIPQSWNRYAYVLNNPLKYVDPTGEAATGAQIADELDGGIDALENDLSSRLPSSATGILLDTLVGAGADFGRGLADVLRLGKASGTAFGEGAGAGETALAVGGDVLRAAAIAAPPAGAGRAAAGRAAVTAGRGGKGLTTPRKFFGDKTAEGARDALGAKFGPPRSSRPDADTFYNAKTGRSFNVHTDPAHGPPHVDIRRRGPFPDRRVPLQGGRN